MTYREQALDFLERSREELDRLEAKMMIVSEIVSKLEGLIEEEAVAPIAAIPAPSPSPSTPSSLFPHFSPISEDSGLDKDRKPIGEIAESLLKGKREGMSLDELYQAMKTRSDILPSSDLKNAIRVGLIRRRARVISEKRGWFRYLEPGP